MDLAAPDRLDNRRIEVVVDGLPLFHGSQLAVDTTLVSGTLGTALTVARWRKATYPELRLVVLGAKVGSRLSDGICPALGQSQGTR